MLVPEDVKQVEWFLNGNVIKQNKKYCLLNDLKDQKSCSLIINDVNKFDAGVYSCRVFTKSGQFMTTCQLKAETTKLVISAPKLAKFLDKSYEFKKGENAR